MVGPLATQSVGVDGSSAGQAFQTAFVGLKSQRFGTLTFGRQVTLLSEGTIKYDPNYNATAFGLLGASNTYSGGGSSENNRLDSTAKYLVSFNDLLHLGALYKFNGSNGSANTAVQGDIGGSFAGASVDAYYSKVNSSITASSLTAAQVAALPALGYSVSNSLAGTISDNTAYALMALVQARPVQVLCRLRAHQVCESDDTVERRIHRHRRLRSGFRQQQCLQECENGTGLLDWRALHHHSEARANGGLLRRSSGCLRHRDSGGLLDVCAQCLQRNLEAFSFDADYRFNVHFDAYVGAMYSGVHDGMASGYIYTTNINPTVGVRFKF